MEQAGWVEMRKLILFGLLAAMVLPVGAAKRITVEQLEQTLAAYNAAHHSDIEAARNIGKLELSERLTQETLDRLGTKLALEPRTTLALELLADQSALLNPPASELPATAPPDASTQQRLIDAARSYVEQTLPRLPNFFATRTTTRFDDSPQTPEKGGWPVRAGLHMVETGSRQITYRDGKEILDPLSGIAATRVSQSALDALPTQGLSTWGEFGPELAVILADSARGKVTFSHWEQTPAGLAAVYRYSVPKAASHYTVNYCCYRQQDSAQHDTVVDLGRTRNQQSVMASPNVAAPSLYTDKPGYHGTLSIDPATGAILRIALEADLKTGDPIGLVESVVEYGPVKIGDRTFICPVRSLAISRENPTLNGHPSDSPTLLVNETSFTNYHRLGTTVRILSGAEEPRSAEPADSNLGAQTQQTVISAPEAPAAPAPPEPATVTPTPPAQPIVPEITLTAANGLPDEPTNALHPQDSGYSLKINARLVDVGIVVYDKKGHPVKDLKPEDFELSDNGNKQEIRFFSQFASPAQAAPAVGETPNRTFANRSRNAAAGPVASAPESGATILLIDESHVAWSDMANARQQILKFLGTVAPGERVGLYGMSSFGFRVLTEITADHAVLIARLRTWMPTAKSLSQAREEEIRNRRQFSEVHNLADLNSVNGNHIAVPDSTALVDPQLLTLSNNPARASLIILGGVARRLSAVPGHKNLVWISSDNVFADWRNQEVATDRGDKYMDGYALSAQEAMNDAHVAVYPMDVSQLEGAAINADIQNRNAVLTPTVQDLPALPTMSASSTSGDDTGSNRNLRTGRSGAEMSHDLHPIQAPIRQVAEGTGGRTIQRAGDLAAEMNGVVEDGHAAYLLSFSPQGPADDKYHVITVKLAGKQLGLTPRYRTGYLFHKEPATLKDRFQQAVWRPVDASEISVTANITPVNLGAQVKVDIAAGDLGMQQQDGRWTDKLDIFFIQRDDAGLHALIEGQTLGLRLQPSTYQSLIPTGLPFERFIQLRPGMASLRVLVVDENSRHMGSVTIPGAALEAGH
jgi:VWFA-related protein